MRRNEDKDNEELSGKNEKAIIDVFDKRDVSDDDDDDGGTTTTTFTLTLTSYSHFIHIAEEVTL